MYTCINQDGSFNWKSIKISFLKALRKRPTNHESGLKGGLENFIQKQSSEIF